MRSTAAMCLVLFAGCHGGDKVTPPPPAYHAAFAPVTTDGDMLRDGSGRALILHGVNAHVAGVFDVTFSDGRAPRELIPSFDASDATAMKAAGFTLLRLPVNWSGIEPMPGQFDTTYLDKIAATVDVMRGSGVYVLIDLHEDGYSKELCEDGAPLWAIDPQPTTLVGGPGPLAGGTDCHSSGAALQAFGSFFTDAMMLQESYTTMAGMLAARFAGDQQVIGYEIMNEPIAVDAEIDAFNVKVGAALRAADPGHLVFFEPSATRNFTDSAEISNTPFGVSGGVYSVHVYSDVFGGSLGFDDGSYVQVLADSIASARQEAQAWKTPLVITEFGIGADNAYAVPWLGHFLDGADLALASWTLWAWKEEPQGNWSLYVQNADGSWSPRPETFPLVSRPYAQAIGGDPTAMTWDGTTLTVAFTGRADVPGTHDLFWSAGTPTIECDGNVVAPTNVDLAGSRYSVTCAGLGAHTLTAR
jgi:endoglycosylceramidase